MAEPERDVFLCHAGEDKDSIVRPLYKAFTDAGISYWYDEAEIPWGHSITQKVNEGVPGVVLPTPGALNCGYAMARGNKVPVES